MMLLKNESAEADSRRSVFSLAYLIFHRLSTATSFPCCFSGRAQCK
jgi:hypothetical protein